MASGKQFLSLQCLISRRRLLPVIRVTLCSAESAALIHTLVQIGKNLGLRTLAEGVETTDELDHLREFDVDLAQGFLLARPLSAAAVETQLMIPGLRDELAAQEPLV